VFITKAQADALFSINVTSAAALSDINSVTDIKYRCNNVEDITKTYYNGSAVEPMGSTIPAAAWPTYYTAANAALATAAPATPALALKDATINSHSTLGPTTNIDAEGVHTYSGNNFTTAPTTIISAMLYDIAEDYLGDANSLELVGNEHHLAGDVENRLYSSTDGSDHIMAKVAASWELTTPTNLEDVVPQSNPAREVLERMQEASTATPPSDHIKNLITDLDARAGTTAADQYVSLKFLEGDTLNFNITLNPHVSGDKIAGGKDNNLVGRAHIFGVRMTVVV
jgi:hypothetical protein